MLINVFFGQRRYHAFQTRGEDMESMQSQGFFAPILAVMAGSALLVLWVTNRRIVYLPYFALALMVFASGNVLFYTVVEKMTVPNIILTNLTYFIVSGLMVHGALIRIGGRVNLPFHFFLMVSDLIGRVYLLTSGYSGNMTLIFGNAMMGLPMALGALALIKNDKRDIQSVTLAVSYASISFMAIFITPISLSFGESVGQENYFSSVYWLFLSFLTFFGILMTVLSFAFTTASDLLRIKEKEASIDFLSGLLTRRAFHDAATKLVGAHDEEKKSIGILVCDIDHFKSINDLYGHDAGDKVIKAFGALIDENMPDGAVAGRIGGEEFSVILSGANIKTSRLFAEGLRTAFAALQVDGLPAGQQVTASFGITMLHPHEQISTAMKRADEALYEAKNSGRNRVAEFASDGSRKSLASANVYSNTVEKR